MPNELNYIAFEGIDGSGKTTQIDLLCSRLQKLNYTPIRLAEPTWGRHGREVRKLLTGSMERDFAAEEKLFTADRREHVEHKIDPLLQLIDATQPRSGFKIVQDRSFYSAPAYQAKGRESMMRAIARQKELAPGYDIVLLIDVPTEVAMARLEHRAQGPVRTEQGEALENARRGYHLIAEHEPCIATVDGVGEEDVVAERILQQLRFPRFEPVTTR